MNANTDRPATHSERWDALWGLETEVQQAEALYAFAKASAPMQDVVRAHRKAVHAKAKLYTALDALTLEELAAYGAYRRQIRAEIADQQAQEV